MRIDKQHGKEVVYLAKMWHAIGERMEADGSNMVAACRHLEVDLGDLMKHREACAREQDRRDHLGCDLLPA